MRSIYTPVTVVAVDDAGVEFDPADYATPGILYYIARIRCASGDPIYVIPPGVEIPADPTGFADVATDGGGTITVGPYPVASGSFAIQCASGATADAGVTLYELADEQP